MTSIKSVQWLWIVHHAAHWWYGWMAL